MKALKTIALLALCLCLVLTAASAATFTDAHGNVIELDDNLEAYATCLLLGSDDAARMGETNLGDLWADALRWFAVSGNINEAFEEDDVTAGITSVDVDADHIVALWNGGNLRADIPEGKFGAETLAQVLPYPNKVAVVYMTGGQLLEALEAASQGLPYTEETAACCAAFMQVSGLKYTVDTGKLETPVKVAITGDWHVSRIVSDKQCKLLKEKLSKIRPDVIILQGDLLDAPAELNDGKMVRALAKRMRICTKLAPTVMVLGNHDQADLMHTPPKDYAEYMANVPKGVVTDWRQICRETGVMLLNDKWFEVKGLRILAFCKDRRFIIASRIRGNELRILR